MDMMVTIRARLRIPQEGATGNFATRARLLLAQLCYLRNTGHMLNDNQQIATAEAAQILGSSVSQLNRLAASGQIPYVAKAPGIRGAYIFNRLDIEALAPKPAEVAS